MERIHPDFTGDERTLLGQFLDYHRATLLMKADGLDEGQVRQTVAGSEMSLLGLVRHMAEVERFWFRSCFVGEDIGLRWVNEAGQATAFHPTATDTLSEAAAAYLEEIGRANEIVSTATLEGRVVHHPRGHQIDMRWILIHMVTETARHNGHADLIRESIDGVTGR